VVTGPVTGPAPLITVLDQIHAEFPDWEISAIPSRYGMWSAWWISEDGRSRHIIMAQTLALLLQQLHRVAAEGR
jgi:hypothetical protein